MRRLTGTERGGLALAAALVIGGVCMIFNPLEMFVPHGDARNGAITGGSRPPEHVSKEGARGIGVGAVLMGTGIAAVVLYQPKSK